MANGWSPERRAKQAACILAWKPWERSTGAKTAAGKARSSRNAYKPNSLTRQMKEAKRQVEDLLAQTRKIRL